MVAALWFVGEGQALIVGNDGAPAPDTKMNPNDYYSGCTTCDPGWDNTTADDQNYVYLGDGWVLSARHNGYDSSDGVYLQTYLPDGSPGSVEQFYRIHNDYYFDYGYGSTSSLNGRQFAVSNPATIQSEFGQTITLDSSNGTNFTDLQLFRINGDPGLPALHLPSAPMPSDYIRTNAPEVVIVGLGRGRVANETHWNVSGTTWTTTTGAGTHQGYHRLSVGDKHFGTNRLADVRPNSNGDPSDPGAVNYTVNPNKLFESFEVVSDSTAIFELETTDGVTRDIISMMTTFDKPTTLGEMDLETQATAGNSGSSVFYYRGDHPEGPRWELVGLVHAATTYGGQPAQTAVFGNSMIISDLWRYMADYEDSVFDIIRDHPDYSHQGDLTLNGIVSGTGLGSIETDDISAFVAGWGDDNLLGFGTVDSWKKGDLNRDGKTDVADFLMLRTAFHGEISASVLTALFGEGGGPGMPGGVPEPSAAVLVAVGLAILATRARSR